jgi:protein phosphatase
VKNDTGPFDIVGDIHGCADELRELIGELGWERQNLPHAGEEESPWGVESWLHPAKRTMIFLGDLVDRGPYILDTLRIVRNMTAAGAAFCVAGNHDDKLRRWLAGSHVQIANGLEQSVAEMAPLSADDRARIAAFLSGLATHYVLDGGRLVVAHAGLREEMHGLSTAGVRHFCLYGDTTGETDEFGLPVRLDWAANYRGRAAVVYGHTPVYRPEWRNNTVNIDTGAVFGGRLTALRYPEREFVSVAARRQYAKPARPLPQP